MHTVTVSPKYQVVIPKMIRDALHLRPGQKMKVLEYDGRIELIPDRDLSELKGIVRYNRNLLEEFINGRMKSSRIAGNLALQEYRRYSDRVYATAHTGKLVEDKEENDKLFVEAVRKYQQTSKTFPVVLTCDRMLVDLCDSFGVNYFLFELPEEILPQACTPEQLCSLLCNLAGVLGLVKVNNMILYGEFRGKSSYNQYKIHYLSGEIPLELERDLEICRELLKLRIDF